MDIFESVVARLESVNELLLECLLKESDSLLAHQFDLRDDSLIHFFLAFSILFVLDFITILWLIYLINFWSALRFG